MRASKLAHEIISKQKNRYMSAIAGRKMNKELQVSFIERTIRKIFLSEFFSIQLSSLESKLAEDAVKTKYRKGVLHAFGYSILLIPSLFLLDTEIVISVLIPATMVAGTAWFSVSLASIKAKFENFGMELTTDLFVAFTLSLVMLLLATTASLTEFFWQPYIQPISNIIWLKLTAAILAIMVVAKLLVSIFSGSLKYDINDAMLTGQNEAAERYFKNSLSILYTTSDELKKGRRLHVANYSIGVAFYEIFTSIHRANPNLHGKMSGQLIDAANLLISDPSMSEASANEKTIQLAIAFLEFCKKSISESVRHKSFKAVAFEIKCLVRTMNMFERKQAYIEERKIKYKEYLKELSPGQERSELREIELQVQEEIGMEDQEMTDVRISVILFEISTLIEEFGHKIQIHDIQVQKINIKKWARET